MENNNLVVASIKDVEAALNACEIIKSVLTDLETGLVKATAGGQHSRYY